MTEEPSRDLTPEEEAREVGELAIAISMLPYDKGLVLDACLHLVAKGLAHLSREDAAVMLTEIGALSELYRQERG